MNSVIFRGRLELGTVATRQLGKKASFTILILILLICGGAYYYYRIAEHVLFERKDDHSNLLIELTCKYGGGETYYSYVVLRTRNGREVSRAELCCGIDSLAQCRGEYRRITGMTLDHPSKAVRIEFAGRPPMEIPTFFGDTYVSPLNTVSP